MEKFGDKIMGTIKEIEIRDQQNKALMFVTNDISGSYTTQL